METIASKENYKLLGFNRVDNDNYVIHYREVIDTTNNKIVGARCWKSGRNGFMEKYHDDRRAAWLFGYKYEH